jgi:hypothetical protein
MPHCVPAKLLLADVLGEAQYLCLEGPMAHLCLAFGQTSRLRSYSALAPSDATKKPLVCGSLPRTLRTTGRRRPLLRSRTVRRTKRLSRSQPKPVSGLGPNSGSTSKSVRRKVASSGSSCRSMQSRSAWDRWMS